MIVCHVLVLYRMRGPNFEALVILERLTLMSDLGLYRNSLQNIKVLLDTYFYFKNYVIFIFFS